MQYEPRMLYHSRWTRSYRQKVPVWPVVSTLAKRRVAISGSSFASLMGCPVLGSFVLSSRSAKLPLWGFVALICCRILLHRACMHPTCQHFDGLVEITLRLGDKAGSDFIRKQPFLQCVWQQRHMQVPNTTGEIAAILLPAT